MYAYQSRVNADLGKDNIYDLCTFVKTDCV